MAATKSARAPIELDAAMRVVLLRGPDRYLRAEHTRRLEAALAAVHGEVEQFTFEGATAEAATVLDELRTMGLLQPHKLVIVDQADAFLAVREDPDAPPPPRSRSGPRAPRTTRELLEKYAADPVETATLLLRADTWRPGRLDKAIAKIGAIIKCETPGAPAAADWCVRRSPQAHGCPIAPPAARALVARIGTDLARLDVELAKLASYAGEGAEIDEAAIRTMVGMTREEQAWVIQSALLGGSPGAALAKMRELLFVSRLPEPLLGWAMTDLLRKLHAASQRLRQGAAAGAVASELRLWGEARDRVIAAARRLEPERFAHLLRRAIETDRRSKSGLGNAGRSLEALAAEIADTLKRA